MPRYIVKLQENDKEWYMEWSTVVDAPVTFGMSLEEFNDYYKEEYGRQGFGDLSQRMERVNQKGTSSLAHSSAQDTISWNRAGKNGTCVSVQQIIDFWCKTPDFKSEKECQEYEKTRPLGKELEDD
jgi:hypothetical protein